ncbi:YihY/virulence factor BrkB family protein [Taibaiella lutea]|uniref:YihY/virulence factor BrkB family protein n=1 Tax=Taibaiella lutea TaxID=2608001 RepID=A0A5M6CG25_9BACT|nr:YihY/virulence factor BrkB family protein [Taibaiella lutea]KAA5532395.1 YihY/virulence factor BrkB family protein [Taibaiella lutea]
MSIKTFFKDAWEILKDTFTGFSNDKITMQSGALAYYTVFSMGPLFVVIISLCSLFLGREAIEGKVYAILEDFVGKDTAVQLQQIIANAYISNKSVMAATIGIIMLVVGATTVFGVIQDSINSIWGLKAKPKNGLWKIIQNRFLSFSMIVGMGFILLVSLVVTGVIEMLNNRLLNVFPGVAVVVFYILNLIVTLGVSTLIFAMIFKVLPDANVKWKDVFLGALITAILFLVGKFAISFYVSQSKVGSTFGAAGSLVVLLIWVYYSSIILYIGAEFTKCYAVKYGSKIYPNDYAVTVQSVVVEDENKSIQKNEKQKKETPNIK